MGVGLDRAEVVDTDHLDILAAGLGNSPEHIAADAAKPIDCDPDCHSTSPQRFKHPAVCGQIGRFNALNIQALQSAIIPFRRRYFAFSRFDTASTTAPDVMPKCLYSALAGALAPKLLMPTKIPSGPITASQPNRTAASIAILTGAAPTIAVRRCAGCASSNSSEGTETTRVAMPAPSSCFCAATAISTSEPDAYSETLASPFAATSS